MKPIVPSLIAAPAAVRPLAKKALIVGMLILAVGFIATPMLMPSAGNAQDARVAKSMAALKDQTAKLGAPKIDGKEAVGGKDAPALYFGSTKMNNNFSVVDEVAKEDGQGMAATLLVKGGDELHPRRDELAEAGRKRAGDWNYSDRPGARVDQDEQSILRRGPGPWHALCQRL
jgi:hypothetical protein